MLNKYLTILCLLLPSTVACYGQQHQWQAADMKKISDVNQGLTSLKLKIHQKDLVNSDSVKLVAVKADVKKIGPLLDRLINNCLINNTDQVVTRRILSDLANYDELMKKGAASNNTDTLSSIVNFIADDVKLKFSNTFNSGTNDNTGLVEVKVQVFNRSNKEMAGYKVFVKPQWAYSSSQIEEFNPTNNAVKKILPGKKLFWIERNGVKVDQKPVNIYLDGNQPVMFSLPIE